MILLEEKMMCALIRTVVELVIFTFCLIVSSSVSQARTSSSPGSEYGSALRNISVYPPCATDGDCATDHKCMQYMCYPWKTSTGFRYVYFRSGRAVRANCLKNKSSKIDIKNGSSF